MLSKVQCVPEETKVLLLKGGTSGERPISLVSGNAVAEALRKAGFPVEEVDTGRDGYLHSIADSDADVVFICLHGKHGEDGTVQGLCELMGKPYVGPGVLASALAMDKARAKVIYQANSIMTPEYISIHKGDAYDLNAIWARLADKCVVKPASEGSALGVSIVHSKDELHNAIEAALAIDSCALIERFVNGVEVTVGVLGNDEPVALPVIEIVPGNEFYDFDAKYSVGGSKHICPARISDALSDECKRISLAAHNALACKGVSRSDIIIDENGICWLLETNTIPGMTPTSLLPDAARVAGLSFEDLCKTMVDLAIEAHKKDMETQASVRP